MNIKKTLLTASLLMGCAFAQAQEAAADYEYVFSPYWYGQAQFGLQETLGETSFGKLLSPNAQLAFGRQFNPLFGARLSLNAWQSKASFDYNGVHKWKWNYVAPMVDVTFNLTNLIGGFNPDRLVDVNLLAGIGANIGFSNSEANKVNAQLAQSLGVQKPLRLLWDGTKARFVARMGAAVDFRITDALSLGLELQANVLPDGYNSKKAGNADWYFNGLVGVKYAFGPKATKVAKSCPVAPAGPAVVEERIVEKVVEVPVEKIVEVQKKQPMVRDIFFTISNTKISTWEMQKVKEVVAFLKANPECTVKVTGYADRGTGTKAINERLSKQRAAVVAKALEDLGIAASRITHSGMGAEEPQPFETPELNRVAICVTTPGNINY